MSVIEHRANQVAHTPGPWEVHEHTHANGEFWCSIGYQGRGPITDVVGAEGNHSRFFQPVAGMKCLVTPVEQQRANAYLVAAAPEMKHVLETTRDKLNKIANLINGAPTPAQIREAYMLAYDGDITRVLDKSEPKA